MKNMLSNAVVTNTQIVSLDNVKVTVNEEIIKYNQVSLSNATERGVKEGALSAIRTSISDYLTNIKTSMQNMYSDIDSSRAFLGQTQAQSINTYIEQIGQSLGSVVAAALSLVYGYSDSTGKRLRYSMDYRRLVPIT